MDKDVAFSFAIIIAIVASVIGMNTCINMQSRATSIVDHGIRSYEWFFDAHQTTAAKSVIIAEQKRAISEETSSSERRRLSVELRGMKASCLSLVSEYNANASKAHVDIFRSNEVPKHINPNICE